MNGKKKAKSPNAQLVVVSDSSESSESSQSSDSSSDLSSDSSSDNDSNSDSKNNQIYPNDLSGNKQLLQKKYQKKSERQHVLDNPDTYIGSVHHFETEDYTVHPDGFIRKTKFEFNPGLYKLFDEGVVNCRDHFIRMKTIIQNQTTSNKSNVSSTSSKTDNTIHYPVTCIDVTCNPSTGEITMVNDGDGIDVVQHPEHNVWIPELIFGHMRTSTNYDKNEKRITGGKNGFGFKLVLIWSVDGYIETVDHTRSLKYTQRFGKNLSVIHKPTIVECTYKPYTRVQFTPDYARFGLPKGLSKEFIALFHRRMYDIAAVTNNEINVTFNGNRISLPSTKTITSFERYVDTYSFQPIQDNADSSNPPNELEPLDINDDAKSVSNASSCSVSNKKMPPRVPKAYENANDRWEFAVALSPDGEFRSVSFVNGIATPKGGKHVDYIMNKITKKLITHISEKKKIDVKSSTIKEQLFLFLRCDIENPSFDSQTKDFMNTPILGFGTTCDVSDAFIEKLVKMGVTTMACAMTELKNNKSAKKTDGTKTKSVRGIPKLIDANFAGTTKSYQCCLLLCEGDSAKAGVISGLSRQDRDYFGVYPMKGKIMNVRGETLKRVSDNNEVAEIKKILGLEVGFSYSPADVATKLRYGKIVFMTDQDLDGSHIKGLGVNLFHCQWPSLAAIQGFISFMNTPILKARRSGKEDLVFYNIGEFGQWQQEVGENEAKKWNIKYYKGLGTSTSHEFKEYFSHKRFVDFVHNESSNDTIDLVFNKKRTEDRKAWLTNYERNAFLNTTDKTVTYTDFLNKELKHFSKYDCERNIPNMVDGLKTSQRKIIFAAFKRNLNKELKVAQFSGYVSEVSGYHHGEASLNGAIIGMAQTFVGSNNINLLQPNGQFGTRLQGGHDHASERYIFTQLNPITRAIFMSEDSNILNYLDDDGLSVEPDHYIPIIPMLLVNGAKGIGTGFSCNFLCYNIEHIIQHVEAMIRGATRKEREEMPLEPYYEGFKGTIVPFHKIEKTSASTSVSASVLSYLILGEHTWLDSSHLHITELPIGVWTDDYKEMLEELIENKLLVKEYVDMSTDTSVDLILTMLIKSNDKMCTPTVTIGNAIQSSSASDSIKVSELEKTLKLYTTMSSKNMHAFDHNEHLRKYSTIHDIIECHFEIRMRAYVKRRQILLEALKREKIIISNKVKFIMDIINGKLNINYKKYAIVVTLLDEEGFDRVDDEFKYLTQMPMESVTEENVARLKRELDEKTQKYEAMMSKTENEMWLEDLTSLTVLYAEYKRYRMELQSSSVKIELTKVKKSKPLATKSKSKIASKK